MVIYKKIQKKYYDKEWASLILSDKPGPTGWRTNIPAPDFSKFVRYLKKNKKKQRILDLGCGGGRHSIMLAKNGFEVFGVDFSKHAIIIAKRRSKEEKTSNNTHFTTGDVLKLKYGKDFFDVINDDGCLHHIAKKDWSKYLKSVDRVLKPGGILRIKVFSINCNYYKDNLPPKSKSHWVLTKGADYTYFFDEQELKKIFGKYKIIKFEEKFHSETKEKKFFFVVFRKEGAVVNE